MYGRTLTRLFVYGSGNLSVFALCHCALCLWIVNCELWIVNFPRNNYDSKIVNKICIIDVHQNKKKSWCVLDLVQSSLSSSPSYIHTSYGCWWWFECMLSSLLIPNSFVCIFFGSYLFYLIFFFHFGLLNHRRSQVEIIVSIIFFSFVFVRSIVVFATLLLMMLSINLFMQFVSNESHGRRSCMKFHERQTFAATMSTDDA